MNKGSSHSIETRLRMSQSQREHAARAKYQSGSKVWLLTYNGRSMKPVVNLQKWSATKGFSRSDYQRLTLGYKIRGYQVLSTQLLDRLSTPPHSITY